MLNPVRTEVHHNQPLLSAELLEIGERFEGILPPAAPGPVFVLCKRAVGVIPLERYIIDGMMTANQADFLVHAVHERQNILTAETISSGKTTLANALLAGIAATGDRVVVGEVRSGEALDLVKVWVTGHPGSITTIHAGSALGALLRLEQLILEVATNPPRALIAEAVNVVVHIAGRGRKCRIESMTRVVGFDGTGYRLADALDKHTF